MKIVILCGGQGTRLREETEYRPKPLVDVGGRPILWHIMKLYAHHGFRDFVLCLGYRGNMIKEYFLNYEAMNNDFTIRLGNSNHIEYHNAHDEQDYSVTLADTGMDSMTGCRVKLIEKYINEDTFMVTYGDGLSDLDIQAALEFHQAHGKLATVTTVRPVSRYGVLSLAPDGCVSCFAEKPKIDGWASAGFLVFDRRVFDYLKSDVNCILEREPLERLAKESQLIAYRHDGFFYAMDTYREYLYLNELGALARRLGLCGGIMTETHADSWHPSSFWTDRPTLVTGATGLVGGWLVRRLLAANADVVCLVRDWVPQSEFVRTHLIDQVKVVRGDVRDQSLLERVLGEYEIDTVFHLAAQTIVTIANQNPISTFETNIGGTWSILEACRRSPAVRQIVAASSDKAYGTHDRLPYSEKTPLQGCHPYDVSKSCADLIAHAYAKTYHLPIGITRCGNFYGGGDLNWNRIVPGTIRSVLRGQPPIIRSDGSYIRDYFYVEDGAAAYMLLAEHLAAKPELYGEAFNFSNELQITVLDLVKIILRILDTDLQPIIKNESRNEIPHQFLDASKARTQLGWQPIFDLEEGLKRTIGWYKEFLEDEKTS